MTNKYILVTGGTGYIGSHTVLEIVKSNFEVIVIDDLSNSSEGNLKSIEKLTKKNIKFYKFSLLEKDKIVRIFKNYQIESVIHFAGFKSVPESIKNPLSYYKNNITGTLNLIEAMNSFNCNKIIFSSSASVYSETNKPPYKEVDSLDYKNPYSHSKLIIEKMLQSLSTYNKSWNILILRYFNPAGSDESGLLGDESINPTNLFPAIANSILGINSKLTVFGNDYETIDGSAVRDYIHVTDLAKGHLKAVENIDKFNYEVFNFGSGKGFTVLQVINEFQKITSKKIKVDIVERREGDQAISYADIEKARKVFNWKNNKNLGDMCKDTMNWYQKLL